MALPDYLSAPGIRIKVLTIRLGQPASAPGTPADFAVPTSFYERILGFTIRDPEEGMRELVLKLDNRDLRLFGQGPRGARAIENQTFMLMFESTWQVQFGYPSSTPQAKPLLSPPSRFVVKSIRGFRTLEIRLYDESTTIMDTTARSGKYMARGGRITRTHVAAAIAQRHGLSFDPNHSLFPTKGQFDEFSQAGVTDAKFLSDLADDVGFIWYVVDDGERRIFYFRPRQLYGPPNADQVFEIGIDDQIIEDFEVEADLFEVPKTFLTKQLDPFEGITRKHKASNDGTMRDLLGTATPVDEDVSISRPVSVGPPGATDRSTAEVIFTAALEATSPPGADADALAEDVDAVFKTIEQNFIKARFSVRGDPRIAPRTTIELRGIGDYGGRYYVSEVTHEYEGGVYRTHLALLKNAIEHVDPNALANGLLALANGSPAPEVSDADRTQATTEFRAKKWGGQPDAEIDFEAIRREVAAAPPGTLQGFRRVPNEDPDAQARRVSPVFPVER